MVHCLSNSALLFQYVFIEFVAEKDRSQGCGGDLFAIMLVEHPLEEFRESIAAKGLVHVI